MRTPSTLVLVVAISLTASSQSLTNVVVSPENPTECDLLTFTFVGTMPQEANFTGFLPDFDADSINIALFATGCGGANVSFNQDLGGLGPFAPGSYTIYIAFSLNGNLVGTDTQVITVQPSTNPDAGEYGSLQDACTGGPNIPLLSVLGGTPDIGGIWLDPNGQVVDDGLFVPGQSPGGFYTYTFDVQEPCLDTSQAVLITYDPQNANAGLNSALLFCEGPDTPIDLFANLGGSPDNNGSWSFAGQPHSNTFTPNVDACGIYTYTVPGVGSCPPTTATVTVECTPTPYAGLDASTTLCASDADVILNNWITGEDTTGYWYTPGFIVGYYGESIDVALYGSGAYGYVVSNIPCLKDTSYVFVTLDSTTCTPPSNDDCTGAVVSSLGIGSSMVLTGVPTGATDSEGLGYSTVWEAFELSASATVVIDFGVSNSMFQGELGWLGLDCPYIASITPTLACPDTSAACPDGNLIFTYGCLPPGVYYVPVLVQNGDAEPYAISISAELPPPSPTNDDCAGAIAVSINATMECPDSLMYSTTAVPLLSQQPSMCGSSSVGFQDVWFVVNTEAYDLLGIALNPDGCASNVSIEVFDNCGGSALYCADSETPVTMVDVDSLQNYYLRFLTNSENGAGGGFSFCVYGDQSVGVPSTVNGAWNIYPNPTEGTVTCEWNMHAAGVVQISLSDLTGRTTRTLFSGIVGQGPQQARFDIGTLASGIYLMRTTIDGVGTNSRLFTRK